MPDNIGEMFYYGEIPWHEKGNELKEPANAGEAIKAGGLDWDVKLVPIMTDEKLPRKITRRVAVVRGDLRAGDPKSVLGVVYPGFRPLQNRDAVAVFDALLGRGKRVYHTGGYLGNGEVIWLLARLPNDIRVAGDDVVEPYMLFTNSHDGTISIDMRLTTVRVVCQNTLALAMRRENSSHVFKRAHKIDPSKLRVEAELYYRIWKTETETLEADFRRMHAKEFGADQFGRFLESLLPLPRPPARMTTDVTLQRRYETITRNVRKARKSVLTVFTEGLNNEINIPPAEETLWGALNSVTAFVDHRQKIKGDRYAHSLFGNGAVLKQKAYELAIGELSKN